MPLGAITLVGLTSCRSSLARFALRHYRALVRTRHGRRAPTVETPDSPSVDWPGDFSVLRRAGTERVLTGSPPWSSEVALAPGGGAGECLPGLIRAPWSCGRPDLAGVLYFVVDQPIMPRLGLRHSGGAPGRDLGKLARSSRWKLTNMGHPRWVPFWLRPWRLARSRTRATSCPSSPTRVSGNGPVAAPFALQSNPNLSFLIYPDPNQRPYFGLLTPLIRRRWPGDRWSRLVRRSSGRRGRRPRSDGASLRAGQWRPGGNHRRDFAAGGKAPAAITWGPDFGQPMAWYRFRLIHPGGCPVDRWRRAG